MKFKFQTSLSVDVGFRCTGLALWDWSCREIREVGLISTEKQAGKVSGSNRSRCEFLAENLTKYVRENNVGRIVAEMPHGGAKSSRAAIGMALASATVTVTAKFLKVPLYVVSPLQVKRVVSDTGSVEKEQIQEYVEALYGRGVLPSGARREHIADAIVAMLAWLKDNPAKT